MYNIKVYQYGLYGEKKKGNCSNLYLTSDIQPDSSPGSFILTVELGHQTYAYVALQRIL